MKVIVTENYAEMSVVAAKEIAGVMQAKKDCVLGLATGETPVGMYSELIRMNKEGTLDFSAVRSVNLDEYYPLSPDNDQSYRYFMNHKLFDHVNIDKNNTYVPDGLAADPDAHCRAYDELIDSLGGVDVQVLGIGRNGHIGFNEPSADGLIAGTHLTDLTQNTIEANARFFDSIDEVPTKALTMGMRSVFKARKIVILASGASKAEAIRKMLSDTISTMCPASVLCLHDDVTLICDKEAYSQC